MLHCAYLFLWNTFLCGGYLKIFYFIYFRFWFCFCEKWTYQPFAYFEPYGVKCKAHFIWLIYVIKQHKIDYNRCDCNLYVILFFVQTVIVKFACQVCACAKCNSTLKLFIYISYSLCYLCQLQIRWHFSLCLEP